MLLQNKFVVLVLLGAIATHGWAQNLVVNPGFEQSNSGKAANWTLSEQSWKNAAAARMDSTEFHSGKQSLLLNQTKPLNLPAGAADAPNFLKFVSDNKVDGFVAVTQAVPVEAGKSYNFSYWYKSSDLVREDRDDPKRGYAAFHVFLDWLKEDGKRVDGKDNLIWVANEQLGSPAWTQVANRLANRALVRPYLAPPGAHLALLRFILTTLAPDVAPKVWIDDVSLTDADAAPDESGEQHLVPLANASFEEADRDTPKGWKTEGPAKSQWVSEPIHSGKKAVAVSDAGPGAFSGWMKDIPIEKNSSYSLGGWIKSGALEASGVVNGAAVAMQFLNKDGERIGEQIISETLPANTDWKQVKTRVARPPADAVTLRLIAGLQFCNGTAWFDDMTLTVAQENADDIVVLRRANPQPSKNITYAANLLTNGDVETADGKSPKGWTYVGKANKDWTPAELAAFWGEGRPRYDMGRGHGEWSRSTTYSGNGALLNTSVDPPLSKNMQWHGRNPVTGYWLSGSMPCAAGKAYLAGGWIRPGVNIVDAWYGPLEIQFFDTRGGKLVADGPRGMRPGISSAPAGAWTYWATLPYVAPRGATTMRLRFGQELSATEGGWGKTYADNLAVWELPEGASAEKTQDFALQTELFWNWFRRAHERIKPPYLPSPAEAPAYSSALGHVENSVPGNVFHDPNARMPVKIVVSSQIGETRNVSLHLDEFDWLGNTIGAFDMPAFAVHGYSDGATTVTLPPAQSYGAFYLEGKIKEGDALVGQFSGRYAILPELKRPRSVENIWGVTTLAPFFGDGRSYEVEMGKLLKMAGFGLAWMNLKDADDPNFATSAREVEWFQSLGIRSILRINNLKISRPIDQTHFQALGRRIAAAFKGKVAAYGNWGVEQSNHRTPDQPVFRPIIDGKMLTDEEYDIIMGALYDGIKSEDKKTPVLIGNIAGDWEGDTVRRLYGKPVAGRFDGAIVNAYLGLVKTAQADIKEFDAHGDTWKTLWQEETAYQRSPIAGSARRYGEAEGPKNMVRSWITMKAVCGSRLKAMTTWGFAQDSEITMVTPSLQPRPQFVAHAVMADALADASFMANHSENNLTLFEWQRSDGPMFTVWTAAGQRNVKLAAPAGRVTVMDVMGNRHEIVAADGVVAVRAMASPVYVFGDRNLRRMEVVTEHTKQ